MRTRTPRAKNPWWWAGVALLLVTVFTHSWMFWLCFVIAYYTWWFSPEEDQA